MYPTGGRDVSIYYNGDLSDYWRNNTNLCGTPGNSDATTKSNGYDCAARIIENGWVMDY